VARIVTFAARLPLALAVVAARAAAHPGFALTAMAGELGGTDRAGLDALDGGDAASNVRAVFSWSYRRLTDPAARLFRLLGLHPGPDITAAAAASLIGLPVAAARPLLTELALTHLVNEHVRGRFTCHDLLRAYAAELTLRLDHGSERDAAVRRMLDHYLHTGHAAAQLLHPDPIQEPITPPPPHAGTAPENIAGPQAAWEWFDAEHPVLLAAITQAAETGWDRHAWQLPSTIAAYLYRRGRWHDLAATQHIALRAARNRADRRAEAEAHQGVGRACGWLGQYELALSHHRQALARFAELGDQVGEAATHNQVGWVLEHQGLPAEALRQAEQALALYRAAGHRRGQANTLNNIGWSHASLGDYGQTLARCEEAAALLHDLGDARGEASTLHSLGYACHHLGRHERAGTYYEQALTMFLELGDRYHQAVVLDHLAGNLLAAGDAAAAGAAWRQALDILGQLGQAEAAEVGAKAAEVRAKLRHLSHSVPEPASAAR
jgi:tetratricopeptide (TPR) repeat protein